MMNKKFLLFSLLSIAQSNFCMDVGSKPELVRLDDGHEWIDLKTLTKEDKRKYLAPFARKVVALRTMQEHVTGKGINKINEDDPTEYVFIFDQEFPRFHEPWYGYYYGGIQVPAVPSDASLRLITLKEAYDWIEALEAFHLWSQSFGARNFSGDTTRVTISNLMPKEQEKYFRNKALKGSRPVQRLLHIARNDPGSPFYRCPKDVVRLIQKAVIDSEARELMKKTDLNESIVPLPLTYKTIPEQATYFRKRVLQESQVVQRILYCKKKNIGSPLHQLNQEGLCFLARCIRDTASNKMLVRAVGARPKQKDI